jgi:hypothetical protein
MLASVLMSSLLPALLVTGAAFIQEPVLVDRIVAVVDGDPIFSSDIDRVVGLGLVRAVDGEDGLRRRALDALIEDRLRLHEVARFGFGPVPIAEVDAQLEAVGEGVGGPGALAERLRELGMDENDLRQRLTLQLQVLTFVEERLGPKVFVGLDEIGAYYESNLVPQLRAANQPLPPIEEVREAIRAVLREQRLNAEIEHWTERLRREAEVIDYLDDQEGELPPVVEIRNGGPPRQ